MVSGLGFWVLGFRILPGLGLTGFRVLGRSRRSALSKHDAKLDYLSYCLYLHGYPGTPGSSV